MTDQSRGKFMKAVFGKDGSTIDTNTAAALLAATYSGGDPQVRAQKIGENFKFFYQLFVWFEKSYIWITLQNTLMGQIQNLVLEHWYFKSKVSQMLENFVQD